MTRLPAIVIFLLLTSVILIGQDKPTEKSWNSLNGNWQFNYKDSAAAASLRMPKDVTWAISSSGNELSIQMQAYPFRLNSRLTYILDGQTLLVHPGLDGEDNVVKSSSLRSRSKWNKNRLTREYQTRLPLPPGSEQAQWIEDVTEKYTLSKDGRRLTFECTSQGNLVGTSEDARLRIPVKLVFDRMD